MAIALFQQLVAAVQLKAELDDNEPEPPVGYVQLLSRSFASSESDLPHTLKYNVAMNQFKNTEHHAIYEYYDYMQRQLEANHDIEQLYYWISWQFAVQKEFNEGTPLVEIANIYLKQEYIPECKQMFNVGDYISGIAIIQAIMAMPPITALHMVDATHLLTVNLPNSCYVHVPPSWDGIRMW